MSTPDLAARKKTNLRTLKWFGIAVAVLAAIGIIGGLSGGGDTSTVKAATTATTAAPTKAAPAASTGDNGLACDTYRNHVAEAVQPFSDLSKGTITMADALKGIRAGQTSLSDAASFSSGTVASSLSALGDALGRARVAMDAGGEAGFTTAMGTEIRTGIKAADAACTAIKH